MGAATWSDTYIPPPLECPIIPTSEIPKSCAESQAAWGSLAKYPGALAAPTRSPVSAPSTVPEPVSAGACSWRHVPRHLENEQVEREKKLCTCALSQTAWCSWVSLAQYPGALAAPTRSPVSTPSTVPEPVGAGACSRRHVPHHLENEQVEREQKPLHLRAVAGGVVFSGLSGSVPSEREGEGQMYLRAALAALALAGARACFWCHISCYLENPVENREGKSKRHCSGRLSLVQ